MRKRGLLFKEKHEQAAEKAGFFGEGRHERLSRAGNKTHDDQVQSIERGKRQQRKQEQSRFPPSATKKYQRYGKKEDKGDGNAEKSGREENGNAAKPAYRG